MLSGIMCLVTYFTINTINIQLIGKKDLHFYIFRDFSLPCLLFLLILKRQFENSFLYVLAARIRGQIFNVLDPHLKQL